MKMRPKKVCFDCMKEKSMGQSKCPWCGFDEQNYKNARSEKVLPPGTVLQDRYMVGRAFNIGGFGITYMGFDQENAQRVVIKEYFPASMVNRDTKHVLSKEGLDVQAEQRKQQQFSSEKEEILREARVRIKIKKMPGIAGGYDCFGEHNTIYIIMEYIEGEPLELHIRRFMNYMSEEEVKQFIEPVILSLEVFHETGIIHRDINPENILVRKDNSLVLIEFEAERMSYLRNDRSMMQFLSVGYTAPEQYMENGKTGSWTDVYSLCATIFYMLTGKTPEDAVLRMAKGKKESEYFIRDTLQKESISKEFSDILIRGMNVDPGARYQTMDDFYYAIYGNKKQQDELRKQKQQTENERNKTQRRKKNRGFWIFVVFFLTVVLFFVLYNNVEAEEMLGFLCPYRNAIQALLERWFLVK